MAVSVGARIGSSKGVRPEAVMLMPSSADGAFVDNPRPPEPAASVRIPFVHGCLLTTRSRVRGGLVCNLSLHGVYVTLDEPLPDPGDEVHVSVQIPGQEPLLQAHAIVTSQNRHSSFGPDGLPPGVGLRFGGLDPAYAQRIRSLVSHHQGQDGDQGLVLPNLPHAGMKRMPYVRPCTVTTRGETVKTVICNMSRMGAYVALARPVDVGEEVRVQFAAQDGSSFDLKSVVAWRNTEDRRKLDPLAPGCGVRFADLTEEDEQRLRTLVDTLSATA